MAYSQGGGKKKVCYYYDGEWPRSLQQGCGEGAAGRSRGSGYLGWLPAGTRTRPSLAVVSRGHAPSLVSGPLLGHAQVWVALSRTCPRGTPVATRGLTAQSRRSGAPPPRPRPLPRSLGVSPPPFSPEVCLLCAFSLTQDPTARVGLRRSSCWLGSKFAERRCLARVLRGLHPSPLFAGFSQRHFLGVQMKELHFLGDSEGVLSWR